MGPAFASFAAVLAQSQEDAERLKALGARNIHVCGSVKFDIRPNPKQVELAAKVKGTFKKKVILLASTREGEEAMFSPHIAEHLEEAVFWLCRAIRSASTKWPRSSSAQVVV